MEGERGEVDCAGTKTTKAHNRVCCLHKFQSTHLPFQLPVVVQESAEFLGEFELGDQVLHRSVVIKGLLKLDQLRGPCQVVLVR